MKNKFSGFSGNAIFFASNGAGKTQYAEFKSKNSDFQCLMSNRIDSFLETYLRNIKWSNITTVQETNDFNLALDKVKRVVKIQYNKKDLATLNSFINQFGIKISNKNDEFDLSELTIKKSRKQYKLNESLPLSASEALTVKVAIISYGILANGFNLVLDDPIELSSLTNETMLVLWIKNLIKMFPKTKIQLLTHRTSVFKELINNYKKMSNFEFYFLIDNEAFKVNAKEYNLLNASPSNDHIKRIFAEKVLNSTKGKNAWVSIDKVSWFKAEFDRLSQDKQNKFCSTLQSFNNKKLTLTEYMSWKYDVLFLIRTSLLMDLCKSKKITFDDLVTLEKLKFQTSSIWKKDINDFEKEFIHFFLNQSLHDDKNWNYMFEFEVSRLLPIMDKAINKASLKNYSNVLKLLKR